MTRKLSSRPYFILCAHFRDIRRRLVYSTSMTGVNFAFWCALEEVVLMDDRVLLNKWELVLVPEGDNRLDKLVHHRLEILLVSFIHTQII